MCHVNRSRIADHFSHEWQSATVVKMKVRNDDTVKKAVKSFTVVGDVRKVGKSSLEIKRCKFNLFYLLSNPYLIIVTHMHSAIEHNVLRSNGNQNTTPTDILSGA